MSPFNEFDGVETALVAVGMAGMLALIAALAYGYLFIH